MVPVKKPRALRRGANVRVIAPASPFDKAAFEAGCAELRRLGLEPRFSERVFAQEGYFAGRAEERAADLREALEDETCDAVVCARGGYGADQLFGRRELDAAIRGQAKLLVGFSDITALEIYLWQKCGWMTVQGPMVAAGLCNGAGAAGGYDEESFQLATREYEKGWELDLGGEALTGGEAEGPLTGGCLTMVEDTLGTPWELDTRGAIVFLEDRGMKPYQVDRSLIHLRNAGKFESVQGIVFGEFPGCEPPALSRVTVREVAERHVAWMEVPVVWGAAMGHTPRPMLTVPMGVRGRLITGRETKLAVLEPACIAPRGSK
jgi:muramoyltetrapeptide carboxypeptidase